MTDQQQAVGRPGRYQRSIAGGIGSMIVLVLVVLAFVVFRGAFRDNEATERRAGRLPRCGRPGPGGRHAGGLPTVPPEGWTATSVDYDPGDRPGWGVGMLTDDGKFVGVRQEDEDLDSPARHLRRRGRGRGRRGDVEGAIVPEWQEWSDAGGDHAYAAAVGDYEVLVYGSASTDDLLTIVRSLSDAPSRRWVEEAASAPVTKPGESGGHRRVS